MKLHSATTRLAFRPCAIGIPGSGQSGWLVNFGKHVLAILTDGGDGRIMLAAGFEEPFVAVLIDWPDFAAAKSDFSAVARLYRAGVVPAMIELTFDGQEP